MHDRRYPRNCCSATAPGHHPQALDATESGRFRDSRVRQRLIDGRDDSIPTIAARREQLAQLRQQHATDGNRLAVLDQIEAWIDAIADRCA
ncbi:MAG: hypothetical protein IPH76_06465 [Xanthomonadales bacterium]|nr:hypothetical protein [Xanthomonadales bacterium]